MKRHRFEFTPWWDRLWSSYCMLHFLLRVNSFTSQEVGMFGASRRIATYNNLQGETIGDWVKNHCECLFCMAVLRWAEQLTDL